MFLTTTILTILDLLHASVIAISAGVITSFPPYVHSYIIKIYDYPLLRILMFLSILVTSFYAPVSAVVYGVTIAIISEDILRSSRISSKQSAESFTTLEDDIKESMDIQVAKRMSPVEDALAKVKQAESLLRSTLHNERARNTS